MINIDDFLKSEMEKLKTDVINRHIAANQVASGKTKASFSTRVIRQDGTLHAQLIGASYSGVLERGRRGGKIPTNFQAILLEWARYKGLSFDSNKQAKQWAYLTAKKIAKFGTKMYREKRNEDIFQTPLADFEKRIKNQISYIYAVNIKNQIFKK